MSLSRALDSLTLDEHTERVLRDILSLFGHHQREWLTAQDVGAKTGRSAVEVAHVLKVLADSYVLEFDGAEERYRYGGDVVVGFEIDKFMRRVESHQSHMRTNVARFRERQGH